MRTTVARYASASGLGDYSAGSVFAVTPGISGATRPNGESDWTLNLYSIRGKYQAPTDGSVGAVSSWMDSNANGSFSIQSFNGSFTLDTTPYYQAPAAFNYLTLTPQSISLFDSIRSGGLTGTFTFNTTQGIRAAGYTQSDFYIGNYGVFGINDGSAFTVTISAALAATDQLYIRASRQTTWWSGTPFASNFMTLAQEAGTLYGATPLPSPGALTVLGLAGLTAGRRRRA